LIDVKEFAKALDGGGKLADVFEEALISNYGKSADLRYEIARYRGALTRFTEAYPHTRKLSVVRAPGRVNLLGEHTDYNGLPVFPMAVERDVVILFGVRKDQRVNLVNTSYWYPPRSFEISRNIRPFAPGNWGNYAKAAAQSLQQVIRRKLYGIDAVVMGDIPADAGLSSSSALGVAVGVALAEANALRIEPARPGGPAGEWREVCRSGERGDEPGCVAACKAGPRAQNQPVPAAGEHSATA
jgi:hypothetical protein